MPINLELHENSDGTLDGRYKQGDKPNAASGGTPALAWSAPQGLSDGNTITIMTDGTYPLGTRTNPTQKFFLVGAEAWDEGTPINMSTELAALDGDSITSSNAFHSMNMVAATGARAGRVDFAYESRLDGQVFGGPTAAAPSSSPDLATTKKNLFYQTTRFNVDLTYAVTASYTGLSGSFTEGDLNAFTKGEAVTVTKSGGGTVTGSVIAVDGGSSRITFELNSGQSYNSTDNNGATIIGDVSGASATLDGVTYIRPDATKLLRAGSNNGATPTNSDVEYNLIVTAAGQHALDFTTQAGGRDDERPSANPQVSTNFQSRMWLVDASTSDLTFSSFLGGNRTDYTHTNSATYNLSNVVKQLAAIDIGVEWPGTNNPSGHYRSRTNAVVLDYEYNCIILANNETFSSATEFSMCRNVTWSNSSSQVMLNYGEIPIGDSVYAFIMNGSGDIVNSSAGVLLGVAP